MGTLRFLLKRFVAQRMLGLAVVVTLAFSVGVARRRPDLRGRRPRGDLLLDGLHVAAVTIANARFQLFGVRGLRLAAADRRLDHGTRRRCRSTRSSAPGTPTRTCCGPNGPDSPLIFRDGAVEHLPFEGEAPGPGEIALPER